MKTERLTLDEIEQIDLKKLVEETFFFDFSHSEIKDTVRNLIKDANSVTEKAVKLFNFVRDEIKYSMYVPFFPERIYRASHVLKNRKGFCIQKAVLLVAMLRCAGIPAVLGFADILNHSVPKEAFDFLGTRVFSYHGFALVKTESGWVKATPTFDTETCKRAGYPVVNFNGKDDAIFPDKKENGDKFIDYLKYHGYFLSVPFKDILQSWKEIYGEDRVNFWIKRSTL